MGLQVKLGDQADKEMLRHSFGIAVVVTLLSCVQLFAAPWNATSWTAACQASLSFTISWSLLKFMSTELVILSNHHNLCHSFLLLPSIFPSLRVFTNELTLCIRWPEYWNFSISLSNEYPGLIKVHSLFRFPFT